MLSWSSQLARVSSSRDTQSCLYTFVVLMTVGGRETAECLTVQAWHTVRGGLACYN